MSVELSFCIPAEPLPVIEPGEIHLWRGGLSYPAEVIRGLEKILSREEANKAGRYRFPRDRMGYVTGRGLLRILLGRYLGVPPAEVRLVVGVHGKPELDGSYHSPISFSLSHAKTLVLYALTLDRSVGVDIEAIHPLDEKEHILQRYFSIKEQEAYAQVPADQRGSMFLELWTRREAYLKGIGKGLAGMEGPERVNLPAPGWELLSFRVDSGYIASLACQGEIGKLSTWEIPPSWILSPAA